MLRSQIGRRRVKKTCRWHVFRADLGNYAAVASSSYPPHHQKPPLCKGGCRAAARLGDCRLQVNPSGASRHLPLHKGGLGVRFMTETAVRTGAGVLGGSFVILQKIHTCLLTILTKMVECSQANIPDNFIPYQEWRRERPDEATATCFSRCQIRR